MSARSARCARTSNIVGRYFADHDARDSGASAYDHTAPGRPKLKLYKSSPVVGPNRLFHVVPAEESPWTTATLPTPFDYSVLDAGVAGEARAMAARIKERLHATIVQTGHDLKAIKAKMPHGSFLPWVLSEFGMSERTAQNYMSRASWTEGKPAAVADLPPSALDALAAPSAPQEIVKEIVAEVVEGKRFTAAEVRKRLAGNVVTDRKTGPAIPEDKHTKDMEAEAARKAEVDANESASRVAGFLIEHLSQSKAVELFDLARKADWNRVERAVRKLAKSVQ